MKKIMLVFGTRPDAVKMCPLVLELKKRPAVHTLVCVTGQHRQMLDQALAAFGVAPDYDLGIMREEQSLFDITGAVLASLRGVLEAARPDIVLVHGDTSTAFAAALACFYMRIPVGHVEAGLRTYDACAPYPEEFNRQAADIISRYHFAPTRRAAENLIREGKDPETVFVTGNTVIDAMRHTLHGDTPSGGTGKGRLILITLHRRESLGAPMRGMLRAVRRVLEEHPDCRAVMPMHRNPAVRKAAEEELSGCGRIELCEPLGVAEFHRLEVRCFLCLTDSGGVQEECASLGRPVLVLRDKTERPEGAEAGTLLLAGTAEESVYHHFTALLDDPAAYEKMARPTDIYGDGRASERIADILERVL